MTPRRTLAGQVLAWVLAAFSSLMLFACSSGSNVPAAAPTTDAGPVAVLPASATVFSEVPTTFTVTGGSGNYLLASSDQSVVAVGPGFSGPSFSIVPNAVSVDTPVTLTVRDVSGGTQASVQVLVKPRTVGGTISITPSAGQSATCAAAVCSGGDAEVVATLTQAGAPLVNRGARFEVLSGDFRFITSGSGATEALATSVVVTTDTTGKARVRIRALPGAPTQTALLQITDTGSGAFQRASFFITPANSANLSAQPPTVRFTGADPSVCANHISADVIVIGGTPPYIVTQPPGFAVTPTVVTSSGASFTVSASGQCVSGAVIAIVDAVGASTSVAVSNSPGPVSAIAPLVIVPTTITLEDRCSSVASALAIGGTGGPYFGASGSSYLTVSVAGEVVSVRRSASTTPTIPPEAFLDVSRTIARIPVVVTDGRTFQTLTVQMSGAPCTP